MRAPHEDSQNWWTAPESRRWTKHRKVVGGIDAAVGILSIAAIGFLLSRQTPDSPSAFNIIWPFWLALLHLSGIGFAFGHRWARFVLWPISVIDLIGFPIVTALGVYNLWVLYHTRGHQQASTQRPRGAAA
jgi:hypothetical protein